MMHCKRLALVLVFLAGFGPARAAAQLPGAQAGSRFQLIDAHALKTPKEVEASVKSLAAYLVKPAKNDLEKTRAIFRWVAHNVRYDDERLRAMRAGKVDRNYTAEETLEKRLAICGGYTNLFKALCDAAGVEAVITRGFSRDESEMPGSDFKKDSHSWNAVKLDGKWQLLEPTWAAGRHVKGKYVQHYEDIHFLMPPEQFIFTHFPREQKWQLLPEAITYEEFAQRATIPATLFKMGFTAKQVNKKMKEGKLRAVVKTYTLPKGISMRIHEAPVERDLQVGKSYRFVIEAKGVLNIAVRINGRFIPATRTGVNTYTGVVTIPPGTFHIYAMRPHPTNPRARRFTTLLTYEGVSR